jgi:type I restriction enzyme S subunit
MNAERLLAHYERIADAPDAIARLRRFILDLAVRGKLVPQDAKDEPVAELLKRITKEKEKTSGRNRVLPTIKNSEKPFQEPPGWLWARMADVFSIRTGFAFKSTTYSGKGTLVFRVTNFDRDGHFDLSDSVYFPTDKIDDKMSGFLLHPGEIIMVMVGGTIGKTTLVDKTILPALLNQNMWRIRSFGGMLANKFEYLLVKCVNQSMQGLTQSTHGHFAMSDYELKVIALPPLAEQHRIVAKVDELMALCDRLEAARAEREATRDRLAASTLARLNTPDPATFQTDARFALNIIPALTTRPDQIKQLRQTILNLAVRGKLVPQDKKDEPAAELVKRIVKEKVQSGLKILPVTAISKNDFPMEVPKNWALTRLITISRRIHYGYTASADVALRDVRMLRITDIQNNNVNWSTVPGCIIDDKIVGQYELKRGDILIARTGGTIGKTFLMRDVPVKAVFASYLIRVQGTDHLFTDYLKLFLESPLYWTQLHNGTRGTGQPNVNGQTLGMLIVPLPPLAEQHRIVTKVNELTAICDQLEANLDRTATTSQNLLNALLTEALAPASILNREEAA